MTRVLHVDTACACLFVIDPPGPPQHNMERDTDLFCQAAEADSCFVRFYGWDGPAVSFGRGQDPQAFLNMPRDDPRWGRCVRRPTGGGIVFHGGDLTFSLGASAGRVGDILSSCRRISRAVIAALGEADIEAAMHEAKGCRAPDFCFAGQSPCDVVCRGHKVSGGAQRRRRRMVLHQASMAVFPAGENWFYGLPWRRKPPVLAPPLSVLLSRAVDPDALREGIARSLAREFGFQGNRE